MWNLKVEELIKSSMLDYILSSIMLNSQKPVTFLCFSKEASNINS